MDTIGTFEVAQEMSKQNLFTTVHKHYAVDNWVEFCKKFDGQSIFEVI